MRKRERERTHRQSFVDTTPTLCLVDILRVKNWNTTERSEREIESGESESDRQEVAKGERVPIDNPVRASRKIGRSLQNSDIWGV